jgi:predicted enzyme related to lactoylglutathione lyase
MTPAVPPPFLVLAADDPGRLAAFYGALLQTTPQRGSGPRHWRLLGPGDGRLEIYAPSRGRPRPRGEGRLALCFSRPAGDGRPLEVLDDWLAAVLALGAVTVEPPRQEPFGAEAWLEDPEGNRLLLLVSAA